MHTTETRAGCTTNARVIKSTAGYAMRPTTLAMFVVLLLLTMLLSWTAYQQWMVSNPPQLTRISFDPVCDLRAGPCETSLNSVAKVSFSINPRNIPLTEPLQLLVDIEGLNVDSVSIDLNGVDMNMPHNRILLQKTGPNQFSGTGSLSFCSRNAMEWETVLGLSAADQQYQVAYRFITLGPAY